MEQSIAGPRPGVSDGEVAVARGLLLALAAPAVAGLMLAETALPLAASLRAFAEIFLGPAFVAVAGWLAAPAAAQSGLAAPVRAAVPAFLCGLAGALAASALAALAGRESGSLVSLAAPAWDVALLPAAYVIVVWLLRRFPRTLAALAVAAHVAGVLLGSPPLVHLVFFLAGMALSARRVALVGLVRSEPEFAVAAGPFLAVLAAAVAVRFSQTGQPPSIAAIGPIALVLGLASGPCILATSLALQASRLGEALTRLGRTAPALAIFWIPLFCILIFAASRGLPPSTASALLMALASLLLIALAADAMLDIADKAGALRRPAHS